MTNYERWLKYTEGLSSPDNFIRWGWYYTIAASLQRRVWLGGSAEVPGGGKGALFPNMYVMLVGPPGVGKGLVIKAVSSILRHWMKSDLKAEDFPESIRAVAKLKEQAAALHDDSLQQQESTINSDNKKPNMQREILRPPLFPMAADATTFEALAEAVAESYTIVNYVKNSENGEPKLGHYGHSSLCFLLPELSSLLRKRTNDTVNYLLGLYDCPTDFEYRTKNSGRDRVRRGCINLMAGTTPGFIQSTFDDSLLDEGAASRIFFIYASKNRKNSFDIPALSSEQLEHEKVIRLHVKRLSRIYGKVEYGEGVIEYLREWWDDAEKNKHKRVNQSAKMIPYYSRKNIHVMKLAMAMHFGESTERKIELPVFKRAIIELELEEKTMHLALCLTSSKISKVTKVITEMLATGRKTYVQLAVATHAVCESRKELDEALDHLALIEQCKAVQGDKNEATGKITIYWEMI